VVPAVPCHKILALLSTYAIFGDSVPTEWLLKLSGNADGLRELQENFSFPECQVIVEDNKYYLKSVRFNFLTTANDVRKEGQNLIRIFNGLAKLKLSNWWEIKIDTIAVLEEN
jgi:hypothetical protein